MKKLNFIIIAALIAIFAVSCCPNSCDAQTVAVEITPELPNIIEMRFSAISNVKNHAVTLEFHFTLMQ